MNPDFKPPKDDTEFEKRADAMTTDGAKNVLMARKKQRVAAMKPFDDEITFLERVLKRKGVTV